MFKHILQLTWFFKRMPFLSNIIKLKIEINNLKQI